MAKAFVEVQLKDDAGAMGGGNYGRSLYRAEVKEVEAATPEEAEKIARELYKDNEYVYIVKANFLRWENWWDDHKNNELSPLPPLAPAAEMFGRQPSHCEPYNKEKMDEILKFYRDSPDVYAQ